MRKTLFLVHIFLTVFFVEGISQNQAVFENEESLSKIKLYFTKANEFDKADDFSNALNYYQLALKECENVKDSSNMYWAMFQIGVIHAKNGNYELAEDYFERTLEIVKRRKRPIAISDCYMALGNVSTSKKDFKIGLDYFSKALEITKKENDSTRMALCLNNIGILYVEMKDVKKAKFYYEQALEIDERREDKKNIAIGLVNVASCYIKLNESKKAIENLTRALELSNNVKSPDIQQQIFEALSNAYSADKNYEKALYYFKLHTSLKDSIFNISSSEKIAQVESKYQFEKKKREIIQLKSDNQKGQILLGESERKLQFRTYIIWFILLVLILLLVFGYLFYRQYKEKEKMNISLLLKNNEILEQKKQIESNLEYTQQLQSALKHDLNHYMQLALSKQMNPHFIFNSLNSIQSYILQNDKLSANMYLAKFADLMRKVLQNSHHEFVTIKDELNTLDLYIELEQKRFHDKFDYSLKIEEGVNPSYFLIPPLILQPYIENAIWHGLLHKSEKGHLELRINRVGENIVFSITDDGIGREEAAKRKSVQNDSRESLGTKITAKRLEIMNSLNKTDIIVEYIDLKDKNNKACGTSVIIKIPAISSFKKENIIK